MQVLQPGGKMCVLNEFYVLLSELIRARFSLHLTTEEDRLVNDLQVLRIAELTRAVSAPNHQFVLHCHGTCVGLTSCYRFVTSL